MGLKVALSNLVSGRSSEFDAKTNSSLLSSVKTATNSKQTNQVMMNLTQQVKDNTSEKKDLTTVDFLRVVLAKQPVVVNDENKSKLPLTTKVSKPPEKMSLEDYNFSFRRAVYDKAMGGFKLTDKEIRQADKALVDAGLYKSIYNRQGTVESFRETQKSQGNELTILAGKENIEYAKRAGQAVLQYQQYQAKQSDADQEQNQSKTNQMLLDPLRLGGNTPFRAAERILNTPRDLMQQIDKGEIMPGSSTAKWIGGKIAEQITGQPAPKIPTLSESVEQLTGAKLPSIPEIELPRPFEYQTEKYKTDGKTGEDVGATAIDLFLLKRGIVGKSTATPESLGNLNISKVFRVQGGIPPRASKFRIFIGESGEMVVKDKTNLFVTFDDMNRVRVFNGMNRAGKAEIISFEVKTSFVQQVRKFAVPQENARMFPKLPQIADKTKTNSSFGLPLDWIEQLKASSIRGTGKIEQLQAPEPLYKLFPLVTTTNQLKEQPK